MIISTLQLQPLPEMQMGRECIKMIIMTMTMMIITIILNNETIPLPEMQMDVGVDWCFGRSDASPGNTHIGTYCN